MVYVVQFSEGEPNDVTRALHDALDSAALVPSHLEPDVLAIDHVTYHRPRRRLRPSR